MLKRFSSPRLNQLPDNRAALLVNNDYHVIDINYAAEFILHVKRETVIGKKLKVLLKLGDEHWQQLIKDKNEKVSLRTSSQRHRQIEKIPQKNWLGQVKNHLILLASKKESVTLAKDINRTQAFLQALSAVAEKINQTENPDIIIQVLGQELKKLELGNLIIRLNEEKTLATVEHLTAPSFVLETIKKTTGISLRGYKIDEKYWMPIAEKYFFQGKALFIDDIVAFTTRVIPGIAAKPFQKALEASIGHTKDKAVYLPLIEENEAYGILGIWGVDLHKEDIPILKIFASQLSTVLKSTKTIKSQRDRAERATRANNFLQLLNHVALKLANITEAEHIIETLSDELVKHDIFFMLAELNDEHSSLTLQHLSMEEGSLKAFNNLVMNRAIGVTVHKRNIPFWDEIIVNRKSQVIEDSFELARSSIAAAINIPIKSIEAGLRILFRKSGWNSTSVWHPLITRGKVMGIVNFWGSSVHIEDSPALAIFANQIANALETARLYTAEKERAEALAASLAESQRQAITDPLTNLYNRYYLYTLGEHEIHRAQRFNQPLSLLMIDVDHFKEINDTHGHLTGDQVLIILADHLKKITRKVDVVARYGGEEFVILLPETSAEAAYDFAERLRDSINQSSFSAGNRKHPLPTISIGIASLGANTNTLEALLNSADTVLYEAKEAGRNTTIVNSIHTQPDIIFEA